MRWRACPGAGIFDRQRAKFEAWARGRFSDPAEHNSYRYIYHTYLPGNTASQDPRLRECYNAVLAPRSPNTYRISRFSASRMLQRCSGSPKFSKSTASQGPRFRGCYNAVMTLGSPTKEPHLKAFGFAAVSGSYFSRKPENNRTPKSSALLAVCSVPLPTAILYLCLFSLLKAIVDLHLGTFLKQPGVRKLPHERLRRIENELTPKDGQRWTLGVIALPAKARGKPYQQLYLWFCRLVVPGSAGSSESRKNIANLKVFASAVVPMLRWLLEAQEDNRSQDPRLCFCLNVELLLEAETVGIAPSHRVYYQPPIRDMYTWPAHQYSVSYSCNRNLYRILTSSALLSQCSAASESRTYTTS